MAKTEEQIRSRNGDEPDWHDVESFEANENHRRQGCAPSDEIKKHKEITGSAMLNEGTKKAIVTEMAPPELATHK